MTIHEPFTLLTDYLLTALGGFFVWRLSRLRDHSHPVTAWWILAFVCLALSSFVGGSYHGLAPNFPLGVDEIWWRLVLVTIAMLGYSMGSALVAELAGGAWRSRMSRFLRIKLLMTITVVMAVPEFLVVIVDYGSAMLAWLAVAIFTRRRWGGWVGLAVALSVVAAWIQQDIRMGWGWLNHNDLFHLIQAMSLYAFYRAALLCRGARGPEGQGRKKSHKVAPRVRCVKA